MKYVNIDTAVFEQREFLEATHRQIGIWLLLYRYCASQENSGTIVSCASWTDALWQRVAACSKAEIHDPSPLWRFSIADSLHLEFYNSKAQDYAQRNRKTARLAGQQSTPLKRQAARQNGQKGGRPKNILPIEHYQQG